MTDCQIAELTDRGVIRVAGPDAPGFLQGLVTNDVEQATDSGAVYTGLLTPQGKILFDFFLVREGDGFLLDCARPVVADLVKRLTFYKLRAAVDLADESGERTVLAAWNGVPAAGDGWVVFADPRVAALGHRLIVPAGANADATATEAEYHAHRIALGVPEGGRDYAFGDTFPHEAGFDQLGGVDFDKGCFVGQEVVSRMEHRGTARKRVVPIEGAGTLDAGAEITADGAPIGTVGSVADARALALVRLDRAEKALANGKTLDAGGVQVSLRQPDWASFDVPGG
ncbi:MAG: folate-binding protein YgfZ [Hyphomicrobiales bacterium]|nr:folate-binding protein YgfZ [Hyphomicrobiales bacterium]